MQCCHTLHTTPVHFVGAVNFSLLLAILKIRKLGYKSDNRLSYCKEFLLLSLCQYFLLGYGLILLYWSLSPVSTNSQRAAPKTVIAPIVILTQTAPITSKKYFKCLTFQFFWWFRTLCQQVFITVHEARIVFHVHALQPFLYGVINCSVVLRIRKAQYRVHSGF